MILDTKSIKKLEEEAFLLGISDLDLMEEAGYKCAKAIKQFYINPAVAEVFCGKGNNAGDAIVIAKYLNKWGWKIKFNFLNNSEKTLSQLSYNKYKEYLESESTSIGHSSDLIVIDGILGIGSKKELSSEVSTLTKKLNSIRLNNFAKCFSIDIPTGINPNTGEVYSNCVIADYTLSIIAPKKGFIKENISNYLGRLIEISLNIKNDKIKNKKYNVQFIFPSNLKNRIPERRSNSTNKTKVGKVAIFAGSKSFTGAAVLTSTAASLIGTGLVTVYVSNDIYKIIAQKCKSEIIVKEFSSFKESDIKQYDSIAIGPGLNNVNNKFKKQIKYIILNSDIPVIIDAEGINILAKEVNNKSIVNLPQNRLLTPHFGELSRLTSKDINDINRIDVTNELSLKLNSSILHKGNHTVISTPRCITEINTTGHPGMASGGMGDVLTGICVGLSSQKLSLHDSACVGSWILGRSAEMVRDENNICENSITAEQVAKYIPKALKNLKTECW